MSPTTAVLWQRHRQGSARYAWFLGKDENDEEEFGLPDPTGFLKDGEMRADMMDEEEAVRPKEAPDTAPWFLEVCCSGESKLADEFQIKGWRVTRFTEDMPLEGEMAKKISKEVNPILVLEVMYQVTGDQEGKMLRRRLWMTRVSHGRGCMSGRSRARQPRRPQWVSRRWSTRSTTASGRRRSGACTATWARSLLDVSWGDFDECMLGLRATSGMHFAKKAQAQNSGAAAAKAAAAPSDQEVEARTASARMARAVDADLILLDAGLSLERGLHVTRGPGYDPDSNSRAERAIGILKDAARRLLLDAGISMGRCIASGCWLKWLKGQLSLASSSWSCYARRSHQWRALDSAR